jgi:hypothetical protein
MKNFLSGFPSGDMLKNEMRGHSFPDYREVNGHIHTPYSFSAFSDLNTIFKMARNENIAVLGINDFNVTDGFTPFYLGCLENRIFPLFNIEFIGLMKKEQQNGIRINDPNNPGRIYFTGKAFDYPFHLGWFKRKQLRRVTKENQKQIKAMVSKVNTLIKQINPALSLTYEIIKGKFAEKQVRERHIAKAIRYLALENYSTPEEQLVFLESLYQGKKPKSGLSDIGALENEIRSNLLKADGAVFVEENERSFLDINSIIQIIISAGGIPCYPVLLDDPKGKFTEFETDPEKLHSYLTSLGIGCIELIPGRNDHNILNDFIEFFDKKGFIITLGTEHNTPEMIPLTVRTRGARPLDDSLKRISWEGSCTLAAHQYLKAQNKPGIIRPDGTLRLNEKREFTSLGQLVIEYYLRSSLQTNN